MLNGAAQTCVVTTADLDKIIRGGLLLSVRVVCSSSILGRHFPGIFGVVCGTNEIDGAVPCILCCW